MRPNAAVRASQGRLTPFLRSGPPQAQLHLTEQCLGQEDFITTYGGADLGSHALD